jgi:Spy/CpxP family protein refolding chaperone
MKLDKRKAVLLAAIPLAFAGAFYGTVSMGEPGDSPPGPNVPHHGGPGEVLVRWLGLSPEQAGKIREADPKFHQDMRSLKRKVNIERLKLAELIEANDSDDAAIEAQFEKVGQMHTALHKRLGKHVVVVRPLLDADQRGRFLDLLAQHLRGPGGPAGPGGPGGPKGLRGPGHPGRPPMPPPGPPHGPPPPH